MNVKLAGRAGREYESLPPALQRRIAKTFAYLAMDLRHPPLDAKKYDEPRDIWQGRLTRDYRVSIFTIDSDTYAVLSITQHPK